MKNIDEFTTDRILRRREVLTLTGLSSTSLWRVERSGLFPKRRKISAGLVGWLASDVNAWLKNLPTMTASAS